MSFSVIFFLSFTSFLFYTFVSAQLICFNNLRLSLNKKVKERFSFSTPLLLKLCFFFFVHICHEVLHTIRPQYKILNFLQVFKFYKAINLSSDQLIANKTFACNKISIKNCNRYVNALSFCYTSMHFGLSQQI